jgi:hypothetical protein
MYRVYYQGLYTINKTLYTFPAEIAQQWVNIFYSHGWNYVWTVKED